MRLLLSTPQTGKIAAPTPDDDNNDDTPPVLDLELISLAINLTSNKSCAELVCGQDGAGLKLIVLIKLTFS